MTHHVLCVVTGTILMGVELDLWMAGTNRGPNEVINRQTVYGSVRLYHRYSNPPGRGRFRCELPSAANPSVNQTLYVNICKILLP